MRHIARLCFGRRRPPFAGRSRQPTVGAAVQEADITVLVPAFCHEEFVADALASVLGQTYEGVRVLVVDDASPDATAKRARSLGDPRIDVKVNETNLGLGSSVAAAISSITTPIIALLNSDDVFHPERLELCRDALAASPGVQLVATGVALVDEEGGHLTAENASRLLDGRRIYHWVRWFDGVRCSGKDTEESIFMRLLRHNFLLTSSNIVCRTSFLRDQAESFSGLNYCLDWQLFLCASLDGALAYLPDELVAYRLHEANTIWRGLETKGPYSREVNAVAARAIGKFVSRDVTPRMPDEDLERLLVAVIEHLDANPEVDGLALYLNEILPAAAMRRVCESSPRIRSLVRQLSSRGGRT